MLQIQEEVAATMVDREPDFEDEKIRMWSTQHNADRLPDVHDETSLSVDLAKEEIYESRAYPLRTNPEIIVDVALRRPELAALADDPESLVEQLGEILEQTTLKVLTKRNRIDGRIGYVVTAVGPELRALLEAGDFTSDVDYRAYIAKLEADLLVPGFVGEPLVVPLEQWRRYELDTST